MSVLEGIKVISFNHFLLGPLGAQFLADQGADVVMVESPKGNFQRSWATGDVWVGKQSTLYLCANRNKRSIAVDMKSDAGREILWKLLKDADVMMENFRPGVMDRLGLGYETVRKTNPRIIYATASGWGSSGPYAKKAGQDLLIQAFSGLAYSNGQSRPTPAASSIVDHHGCALFAAAITGALVKQLKTGKGSRVEVDLLSAALDLQLEPLTAYMNAPTPRDSRPKACVSGWHYPAPYGVYSAKDGYVAISLGPLADMASALNTPELASYSQQDTWDKTAEVSEIIERETRTHTTAELMERFEAAGLWIAPVNDFSSVAKDPQVLHNETFDRTSLPDGNQATVVRHAIRYDGERPGVRIPPPSLGAHTLEILEEHGFNQEQIEAFIEDGVVAAAVE